MPMFGPTTLNYDVRDKDYAMYKCRVSKKVVSIIRTEERFSYVHASARKYIDSLIH